MLRPCKAQDVSGCGLDLDAPVRGLDDLHARASSFLWLDGMAEQAALDGRKRRSLKAAFCCILRLCDRHILDGGTERPRHLLDEVFSRAPRTVEKTGR